MANPTPKNTEDFAPIECIAVCSRARIGWQIRDWNPARKSSLSSCQGEIRHCNGFRNHMVSNLSFSRQTLASKNFLQSPARFQRF